MRPAPPRDMRTRPIRASRWRAALLLKDGAIVTGTNFENASYGLSLCAETVALATANAQGRLAARSSGDLR